MEDPEDRPVRVVYTKSGVPTAAIIRDDSAVIDHLLYWIDCRNSAEAHYLLSIINSDVLSEAASQFMSRGQFGTRDLHKHLWKLPIPEFGETNPLHVSISEAGVKAAEGASGRLSELHKERDRVTVNIARRELRGWLRGSEEGRAVEEAVSELIS